MPVYQKPLNIIPANEEQRLKKLEAYEILDTPADQAFDKIARLAAQIFNTPIAQITFVDRNRTFFKANISPLEANEVPREDSFCSLAILNDDVTLFENMLEIPDLANHKFVQMENGIRFYAGAPLRTREGYQLGTVCVLDVKPRTVTNEQLAMLNTLSGIAIDELELRLAARKTVRIQTDMVNRVVHDLKNPNTTIRLSAELIRMKAENPAMVSELASRITSSANAVLNNLNNLLDLSHAEDGNFRLNVSEVRLDEVLPAVKRDFDLLAKEKSQQIIIEPFDQISVSADLNRLTEIFGNLVSNALKYSLPGANVVITVRTDDERATIEVRDEGLGLSESDMPKLFTKFARLSSVPTGREHSNGLGLFLVKTMIELHKGKVWATSQGKNKGASFFVSLPLYVSI